MKTLFTKHAIVMGGRDGSSTNPEELFAQGYAACFGSAVGHVAKQHNVDVDKIEVKADVSLNQDESGFFIAVTLNTHLSDLEQALAERVVREAHQVCPYSKATRGNITVTLKVTDREIS
jgi:lipoyl-dependent peroxiredoxin